MIDDRHEHENNSRTERPGPLVAGADALRRFFAGTVGSTFQTDLGVADPGLTDYLTDLLVRFTRWEAVGGTPGGVTALFADAAGREGPGRRDRLRHAGDVALFWTGLYPARLARAARRGEADGLADVSALGKAAYRTAAIEDLRETEARPVLLRLADQFELCGTGLGRVRGEWERLAAA